MNYKIIPTKKFEKELKTLTKKYPSLKKEYSDLLDQLEQNSNFGTPLGKGCYKIRISIASKGGGKSGGGRVITCVRYTKKYTFLIAIFDKGDLENLSDKKLKDRLKSEGLI